MKMFEGAKTLGYWKNSTVFGGKTAQSLGELQQHQQRDVS